MGKRAESVENAYHENRAELGSAAQFSRSGRFQVARNGLEVVSVVSAEPLPKRVFPWSISFELEISNLVRSRPI